MHPYSFRFVAAAAAVIGLACCGCQRRAAPAAAPSPVLKSAAELAAQRETQIAAGQIAPGSGAAVEAASPEPAPPPTLPPGSINPDILVVNDTVLTAAEVLFPISSRIAEMRGSLPARAFAEQVRKLVRDQTQQEVGLVLLYEKGVSRLDANQREALDKIVERELNAQISRDFGGSRARFEAHLAGRDLTLEQFKARLRRQMVAQEFAREELLPQVRVSRSDLMNEYRRSAATYATPETRELWMIEAPFAAFLARGQRWLDVADSVQATARNTAADHIRSAHAALRSRPFADVAREFSKGVHASEGGKWGVIGEPLRPPYDQATRRLFEMQANQYTEPIETDAGWVIVRCGQYTPAVTPTFADVQEQVRAALTEARFNELLAEYIGNLAREASVSSLDSFAMGAMQRALGDAPR